MCADCGAVLPWKLDPGQAPLFGSKYEKSSGKVLSEIQQISENGES
jgi:hypothetical protein